MEMVVFSLQVFLNKQFVCKGPKYEPPSSS